MTGTKKTDTPSLADIIRAGIEARGGIEATGLGAVATRQVLEHDPRGLSEQDFSGLVGEADGITKARLTRLRHACAKFALENGGYTVDDSGEERQRFIARDTLQQMVDRIRNGDTFSGSTTTVANALEVILANSHARTDLPAHGSAPEL